MMGAFVCQPLCFVLIFKFFLKDLHKILLNAFPALIVRETFAQKSR
jgi:hypothetical protein